MYILLLLIPFLLVFDIFFPFTFDSHTAYHKRFIEPKICCVKKLSLIFYLYEDDTTLVAITIHLLFLSFYFLFFIKTLQLYHTAFKTILCCPFNLLPKISFHDSLECIFQDGMIVLSSL